MKTELGSLKFETVKGTFQGRGYSLRKREKSPYWYVNFEAGGKRYDQSTGSTVLEVAHRVGKLKLGAALDRRFEALEVSKIKREVATLGEIVAAFEAGMPAQSKIGRKTIQGYVSSLRCMVRDAYGPGRMEELRSTVLTRELVVRFKERRYPAGGSVGEQERAMTTINSAMTQARALFSRKALEVYADRKLKLPELSGFLGVTRFEHHRDVSFRPIAAKVLAEMDAAAFGLLQPDAGRVRKLEGGAVDLRLAPARPDVFVAYLMARMLGMRDIEIAAARWEWLEESGHGWQMAITKREYFRPKQSEGRVPVAPAVYELLRRHGDRSSVWIVPARHATGRQEVVYRDCNFFLRQWLGEREKGMHELRKQAGSAVYTQTKSLSLAAEFLRTKEDTCRKHYAKLLVPPPALEFVLPRVA